MDVKYNDILVAQKKIQSIIRKTPCELSHSVSEILGASVYFKYENTQATGSFKIRGAFNKIANLSDQEKARGVVASSAGNHAQGVALSAKLAGVRATIVMPETAPLNKLTATKAYGAEVIQKGDIYDEAYEFAKKLEQEKGFTFVHPYEDPLVIAGQGTLGIEIHEAIANLDAVIIPVGGGGLISGVAVAIKELNPKIRVIGVQSAQAPGMNQLFHQQSPSKLTSRTATIADGISIKNPSQKMYDNFIKKYVDEMVTVNDEEIAEALVLLLERVKTVCEGSAAVGLAALMNQKIKIPKSICVLLSGGNIDLNVVAKVIEKGQIRRGRLIELSVIVDDLPGNLNRLTKALAEQRANILEVHHDRVEQGLYLRETKINFVLETLSPEHIEEIKKSLTAAGGRLI